MREKRVKEVRSRCGAVLYEGASPYPSTKNFLLKSCTIEATKKQFSYQVGINNSANSGSESVGQSTYFGRGFATVQMVGDPVHEVAKDVSTGTGNQFS